MLLTSRLHHYARLTRCDQPIGTLLLLWPTLWALWIAGEGRPKHVLIFVMGVIVMRAAGCAINDYADRHIDRHVLRTRQRPLATGSVTPQEALSVFCGCMLLAFLLVLQLPALAIGLAVIGALLATGYPFTKRFFSAPQLVLGLAFSWGIPMAFAAEQERVPSIAWLLFAAATLWPLAYDTIYAMMDRDDDRQLGIHSTALLFGAYSLVIIVALHSMMLILLAGLGYYLHFSTIFFMALAGAAMLCAHQWRLVASRQREAYRRAFLQSHWIGAIIWLGLVAHYLMGTSY